MNFNLGEIAARERGHGAGGGARDQEGASWAEHISTMVVTEVGDAAELGDCTGKEGQQRRLEGIDAESSTVIEGRW